MAKRPVFIPLNQKEHLVDEIQVDFEWHSGFAAAQKKKNIAGIHNASQKKGLHPLLEISTKSDELLGKRLSAFNLKIETEIGAISVEAAFQGSKVFEQGGPYTDIYKKDSVAAKKDQRIRESGKLIGFNYFGQEWPLVPKTAFYDWLYLTALSSHQDFLKILFKYKGFTDIEFNPQKSINCQARTVALLVSLLKLNLLDEALRSQSDFIAVVSSDAMKKGHSAELLQEQLL
jgi:hypothetical protein